MAAAEYTITLPLSAEQLEPFGAAVNFVCIFYPKLMNAGIEAILEIMAEENPKLLPNFSEVVDSMKDYCAKAAVTGDVIAHHIGRAEPVRITKEALQ